VHVFPSQLVQQDPLTQAWPVVQLMPHWPQLEVVFSAAHTFEQQPCPAAQQVPEQAVVPDVQVRQSVSVELQPFVHAIVPGVGHCPLALQTAAAVLIPVAAEHEAAAPQLVFAALFVVSVQTELPLEHDVVPFLHGLAGWHAVPSVHEAQVPARQNRFVPQLVPSETG
jgi:hypothetical protein